MKNTLRNIWTIITLTFAMASIAHSAAPFFQEGLISKGAVTIGEKATPNTKSVLDLRSTTKGFLPPRMTEAQRDAISSPPAGLLIYNTDASTLNLYDGATWGEVAGGGEGGINYITGGDAESGTTGFATYSDAAGTVPVDGTGGSANITFATTPTDPLRGDNSFLITKDAINRQGQGVSYDFTIAREDRGNTLQIDYSLEITSGTYATGDLAIYIYDVTNGRLIQPSAYQIENTGVGTNAQPLTFQTNIDSVSYRLIVHTASTSALAYTVKLDSIKIGPSNTAQGPPQTDWIAYTPVVTAISGTLTNYTVQGLWRQKGDSADYKIRLVFTGSPGTWSNPLFSLPTGQVIDDTKIPGGSIGGYNDENWGTAVDSGTQSYKSAARPYTTTTLIMQQLFVSGSTVVLNSYSQTSPFTWVSGDEIEFTIKNVPIVGWSSNTVVSSSANVRPVTARYITTTAGSYGTGGAVLDFTTKVDDSHGAVTTGASWKYTAKVPGKYRVNIGLSPSGTNGLYAELYKNGATYARLAQYRSGANPPQLAGGTQIDLLAGDYINIVVFSETATTSLATSSHLNFIDIAKIDGPSQIQAGNLVVARYTTAAGQSTNGTGSATLIDFGTKDFDLLNSVTTGASWKFTAPAPGYYEMCAMVLLSATTGWADTEAMEVTIYKNGSAHQRISYRESFGSGSQLASGNGCGTVQLNATEYIDLRITQLNGSNINMFPNAQYNWIAVKRIGGLH